MLRKLVARSTTSLHWFKLGMAQQQSIARFFGGGNLVKRDGSSKSLPIKGSSTVKPDNGNQAKIADSLPIIKKRKIDEATETKGDTEKVTDTKDRSNGEGKVVVAKEEEPVYEKEEVTEEEQDRTLANESTLAEARTLIELSEKENHENKDVKLSANVKYKKIAETFDRIEAESSRLKITAIVSEFFLEILQQSTPETLVKIVYLFINRLGPDYEPDLELGLGETLLIKAISECYGRSSAKVRADYKELGDLGMVAQKSRSGQRTMFPTPPLEVDFVFDSLRKIAKSTGKDSQSKKIGIINKLLTASDSKSSEAKFIVRSLEGKLRIGLAEKTVLVGLAQAFVLYENKKVTPELLNKVEDIIREAFSQVPNYEILIQNAYKHGVLNLLDHCQLTPGIPLKPMLAKPTKSISEVLDRFQDEEFTCEYKYDGERAQIHLLGDGVVKIYSRNSEDMSQRYPDLISIISEFTKDLKIPSMIMDCEAVAWDRVQSKILPFQVLSTRKRKDVDEKNIKVHICLFVFDLLYFNNEPLITKTLSERRKILSDNIVPIEGKLQLATHRDSSNLEELQAFLDQSVKDSCEGLMVKMLNGSDSYYEPSKRSRNWLKLKKDYLAGVGDSLDLVVIGAYYGRGKRTGAYGGLLLASYNEDSGEFETTCKIGTGFSDEDLANFYNKLKPTEISQPKSSYVYDSKNSNAKPDVWFEPTTVIEVLTADLSLSPIYKAGHSQFGKGISLRFPRFIRVREDKGVEDATTSTDVIEFYERQSNAS
jgi:DNA ligase-1